MRSTRTRVVLVGLDDFSLDDLKKPVLYTSPELAAVVDFDFVQERERLFVGAPNTILARLLPFIAATHADEVMITTMIYDHAARRHSYELMAQAFGLAGQEGHVASG